MSKYYVGDIGTKISVDVGTDVSTATTLTLKVKKPDETLVDWPATLEGLTTLYYIILAGDFDQVGKYLVQAYVVLPGWSGRGDSTSFEIEDLFK